MQISLNFLVVVCMLQQLSQQHAHAFGHDVSVKAGPAIYNIELNDVDCYEATIPMFFSVGLPSFPDFPQPIDTSISDCSSGNNDATKDYCDLAANVSKTLQHIMKDLQMQRLELSQESRILAEGKSRTKRQATPIIAATSLIAGFLLRPAISKFTGKLFGSDEEWITHFNSIRDSLVKEHQLLINFENATHEYTNEMEKILDNLSQVLTEQKRDMVWSLWLLSAKIHSDIIQDAIQSCKSKHIPGHLIKYDVLQKKLESLKSDLHHKNFNYTLAIDTHELGKYYKLPIADCLFTPTKAHITINIPLKSRFANWKLYEIIHTKYAFNNQVCELYPQEASYLAVSQSDKESVENRTVLITNHMLQYCSVYEHQLCMIPQFTTDSVQSLRCTAGMHNNLSPVELLKSCSFRCYSNDELIITQITDTKIVVTNAGKITYACGDKHKGNITVEKLGALEINLNCGCTVTIDDTVQLPTPFPCIQGSMEKSLMLNVTVPILWTHNFSSLENAGSHNKLRSFVNHHWPWLIPVLNLTKQKISNFTIADKAVYSPFLSVHAWLGLLTTCILLHMLLTVYCFFKMYIRYRVYELSDSRGEDEIEGRSHRHRQSRHHHHHNHDDSSSDENDSKSGHTKPGDKLKANIQFSNRLI